MVGKRDERRDEARPTDADRPTADSLRADIDSGRTHDKVAHPDPAAAPLGTDAEAAGAPPDPGQVESARRQETARHVAEPAAADRKPAGSAVGRLLPWAIGALVNLVAIGVFAF